MAGPCFALRIGFVRGNRNPLRRFFQIVHFRSFSFMGSPRHAKCLAGASKRNCQRAPARQSAGGDQASPVILRGAALFGHAARNDFERIRVGRSSMTKSIPAEDVIQRRRAAQRGAITEKEFRAPFLFPGPIVRPFSLPECRRLSVPEVYWTVRMERSPHWCGALGRYGALIEED